MTEIILLLVIGLASVTAAWLVNAVVAFLSGDHPRDTPSVWLDMMLGELRGITELVPLNLPRWARWAIAAILGGTVFAILWFVFLAM